MWSDHAMTPQQQQQQQPSIIPQVGSGEGNMYADLTPTPKGREAVSRRPSAQKSNRSRYISTIKMHNKITAIYKRYEIQNTKYEIDGWYSTTSR